MNHSINQARHATDATVQNALAELPILAAMLAAANVAAAVVMFQRARYSLVKHLGLTTK